ncbi:hypothetical protein [Clostridium sp. 001]|uniref:hypothetical protein n=1 Tax=Clostridium sp. 001 TaxID=1970093 RepID=UPI001C2CB2CC|nr:hypothetical protein [Clostridium sp. 001]QXE18847.1 hypothetical protein B5S50_08395 [Clostridium sp. 001]
MGMFKMKNKKLILSYGIICIATLLIVLNVIQFIQNKRSYDSMTKQILVANEKLKNQANDYSKLKKEVSTAEQSIQKLSSNKLAGNNDLSSEKADSSSKSTLSNKKADSSSDNTLSVAEAQTKLIPVYMDVVQKGGNHFTGSFNIVNTNYKINTQYYYSFQDDRGNSYYVNKSTGHIMYQLGADKTYIDYK